MTRLATAAFATLTLAACATASAAPQQLVNPIRGDTSEMRVRGGKVAIRIPVDLAKTVRLRDLRVIVVSVALGQRLDRGITDAFAARLESGGGRGPALILTVDVDPGLDDGTYSVLLDMRRMRRPGRRQRLTLTVVHPVAKLRPPLPLRVQRTSSFLGLLDGDTNETPLPLRENGGKSKLSDIQVVQVDRPAGDATSDGELVFEAVPAVEPRGNARVPYDVKGDFGLGTTTGTLEVDAPQLESPVPVAYEVKRRLHPGYIVLFALIGVALGYVLRVWLKRLTERSRARLAGIEVIELMDREIERRKDAGFRTTVRAARETLRGKLASERDAANLNEQVSSARGTLETALKDLDAACDRAQAALERLQVMVDTPWAVPAAAQASLSTARRGLGTAERKLAGYDATGAEEQLTKIEGQLLEDLAAALADWQAEVRRVVDSLGHVKLPPALAGEVRAIGSQLDQTLDTSTIDASKLDPEKALTAVHAGEVTLQRLLREVLPRLRLVVGDVRHILADADIAPDGALASAEKKMLEALDRGARRAGRLNEVSKAVNGLAEALSEAILAGVPEAARAEAVPLLDGGHYERAARVVAEAARAQAVKDTVLGDEDAEGEREAAEERGTALLGLVGESRVPQLARATRTRVRERDPLGDLRSLRFLSWLEGIQASIWRTVIVAVVVALGALAAFQATWDGSLDEVIAVFFWGFGLDFSIESAIDIARGSKQEEEAVKKA